MVSKTSNNNEKVAFWDGMVDFYSTMELVNFQGGFSTFVLAGC